MRRGQLLVHTHRPVACELVLILPSRVNQKQYISSHRIPSTVNNYPRVVLARRL